MDAYDVEKKINEIKTECDFYESYHLHKSLQELSNKYDSYQKSTEILQNIRPARIRKKLNQLKTHLIKSEQLLDPNDDQSLYQFIIDTYNASNVSKFINNDLPDLISIIENKLNEAEINSDIGGVKRGSVNKFLITNLLMIYKSGTGKDIKIYWDRSSNKGSGEAFNYLIRMREILPQINPTFRLSKSDKNICNEANELLNKLNSRSLFRTKK